MLRFSLVLCLALALAAAPSHACTFSGGCYTPPAVVQVIQPAQVVAQVQAQPVLSYAAPALAVTAGYGYGAQALAFTGGYSRAQVVAPVVVRQRVFAVRGIHGDLGGRRFVGRQAIVVRGRGLGLFRPPAVIIRRR